ncbi:SNF2 family DNA-dependent ATPase [Rhizoctonia solani 123E]|uniref:SNF2 family DNA-dependent ATPase n=1 Tax=Rhizoctonia solani 123E TaxID=1423351 RepID=A0A074RQX1_9AGAM|nr:SNF2 family DNA-dependent ATPase [Rhizoctonia solani 123E]
MSAVAPAAIDLTGNDDEWAQERESKRQRTSQPGPSQVATVSAPVTPAPSGPSTPTNGTQAQAQAQAPTWTQPTSAYAQWYGQYPPPGPSYPAPYGYYPGYAPTTTHPWTGGATAIDLTSTPSPPAPTATSKLEGRTVMCIGELSVTALILYPIRYLAPSNTASDATPATPSMPATCTVKLRYDSSKKRIGSVVGTSSTDQTINIASPTTSAGPGEDFGVVDQKAANVLAPLMERGLIRQEARVVKGSENPSILPLKILLFTPKGNIPTISQHLSSSSLYLEHPCIPYNPADHRDSPPYDNPHNPPPGGYRMRSNLGSAAPGRWNHSTTATGTSVEVQRSQVDEVFKSLMSGDDLDETEAGINVATRLYPHQKEALTFLLEREKEVKAPKSRAASLWTTRKDSKGRTTWYNIVTQKETRKEPAECRGAILADDMGLGKTISVVSLIARTLDSARSYGGASFHPPPPKPVPAAPVTPAASFTAAHFAGSVWGMPSVTPSFSNSKAPGPSTPTPAQDPNKDKAKSRTAVEDAQRAARLKTTSRATLIVCPLSTVANWEDQFKDHWAGEVVIVGGSPGGQVMPAQPMPNGQPGFAPHAVISGSAHTGAERIRVYVYHGPSRRPDPAYLADFDAVITTYSTLAVEYSRQVKSLEPIRAAQVQARQEEDDEDDDDGESDSASSDGIEETDQYGEVISSSRKKVKKGVKRKKPGAMFTVGPEATSPLQSVNWFRIVLDEAHSIKEPTTIGSRACCDLIADRRLCLTGTPVQNKLDDVFALLKFLRLEPFDDKAVWTEYIGGPAKFGQPLGIARLQAIMKSVTLRRTKETKKPDGTPILSLPPRRDELRLLQFEAEEKAVYDSYFTQSKAEFNQLSKTNQVMKNYVGILQKILRLRQICDHYELVKGKDEMTPLDYDAVLKAIVEEGLNLSRATAVFSVLRDCGTAQCVECQTELASAPPDAAEADALETDARKPGRKPKGPAGVGSKSQAGTRQNSPSGPVPVVTRCQHLYCIDCFRTSVCPGWPKVPPNTQRPCSTCQSILVPAVDAIQVQPDAAMSPEQLMAGSAPKQKRKEPRKKGGPLQSAKHSTKIKALIDDLMPFSRANPYSINYDPSSAEVQSVDKNGNVVDDAPCKSVVFSQWTSMLDKIEDALEEAAIRFSRLDGTMKREDRSRAMDALKMDPSCEILLVSLRAGGVGLNLTAARRVYLMDPYWNPAVENQAVDRIHRLGQTKPVTTIKLIIENTIEARLLEVQKRKIELANMTLGVQLSKADQAQRRLEELSVLFK